MTTIRLALALAILSVLVLAGSVYLTTGLHGEPDLAPRPAAPQGPRYSEFQDYRAYESLRAALVADAVVPADTHFQPYEKGLLTYRGDGVWAVKFWADLPDGTRQVFFTDYQDGHQQWTRVIP